MVPAVWKMKQAGCTIVDMLLLLPPLLPVTTTTSATTTYHHHALPLCRRVLLRVGGPGFLQRLFKRRRTPMTFPERPYSVWSTWFVHARSVRVCVVWAREVKCGEPRKLIGPPSSIWHEERSKPVFRSPKLDYMDISKPLLNHQK